MSFAPISMKTGDSISAYRIVRAQATAGQVAVCTATTDIILGVTTDNRSNAGAIPVAISGISKVYMNDTCAAGALVMTNNAGQGVPFTESTAGVYSVGVCLNTVTATGTLAEVLIRPQRHNDVP